MPTPISTLFPTVMPTPPATLIFSVAPGQSWTNAEIKVLNNDAGAVASALASEMGLNSPVAAFYQIYGGPVTVIRKNQTCTEAIGQWYSGSCSGWAYTANANEIWIFANAAPENIISRPHLLAHELGHAFENALANRDGSKLGREALSARPDLLNRQGFYGPPLFWQLSTDMGSSEIFADMFLGWAYNKWEEESPGGDLTPSGAAKAEFMREIMSQWLSQWLP